MAGIVLNIKVCSPLKLHNGLTGNYHAICHYSYNLPLEHILSMKKRMVIIFLLISHLTIIFGQDTKVYVAKCREFRRIVKYECARLTLYPNMSFTYQEIAVDIAMVIENGEYYWIGDTLTLKTKEYGLIKYLKYKKELIIQENKYPLPLIESLKENVL